MATGGAMEVAEHASAAGDLHGEQRVLRSANRNQNQVRSNEFELNKEASLKKKLEACERQDIKIKPYRSGLLLEFSSVMYEAMRAAVNDYFDPISDELNFNVTWKKDVDLKKQNHRDVVHVNTVENKKEYTMQLFHTTSGMQVNGSEYQKFVTRDLPNLQKIAKHYISSSGYTSSDLNDQLSDVIRSSMTQLDPTYPNHGRSETSESKECQKESQYEMITDSLQKATESHLKKNEVKTTENGLPSSADQIVTDKSKGAITKQKNNKTSNFHCLFKGCKYGRTERSGVAMIQCSLCFTYFHYPCTGDDENLLQDCVVFTCRDCRTVAGRIYSIMTNLDDVKDTVNNITTVSQTVEQLKTQCRQIQGELKQIKSAVNKIQKSLENQQSRPPVVISQPHTLSGYSTALKTDTEKKSESDAENKSMTEDERKSDITKTTLDSSADFHTISEWQKEELSDDWTTVSRKYKKKNRRYSRHDDSNRSTRNRNTQQNLHSTPMERKYESRGRNRYQGSYNRDFGRRYQFSAYKGRNSDAVYRSRSYHNKYTKSTGSWKTQERSHRDFYYNHYRRSPRYNSHQKFTSDRYMDNSRFEERNEYIRNSDRKRSSKCKKCGESNHNDENCWFDKAVKCRACNTYGHKEKHCFL